MQVVPNITIKALKDCVEGELVIVQKEDGSTAIGIVSVQELCEALILLDKMGASSSLIKNFKSSLVGSMGVDYRVEVDADCASFADSDSIKEYPGCLKATKSGWEMAAHTEEEDLYSFILLLPMTAQNGDSRENSRVIFPRWSIVIDRKTVFKFDATVK